MSKVKYVILALAVLTAVIASGTIVMRKAGLYKLEKYTQDVTDKIISEMNDDRLIGQLFMFYFNLDDLKFIEEIKPGGIFILNKNIPTGKDNEQLIGKMDSEIETINDIFLKQNMPLPFYSIDQEGGRVRRIQSAATDFPSAMDYGEAYASTQKSDLPMLSGFHTCIQLRQHGIQWPLTPVADVQINPDNPVIGERSFGSDPKLVYKMISSYVRGVQNARCMDSVKHFPGHGDTNKDSHRDLPQIHKSLEELNSTELYPYKNIFKEKEPPYGLMSAHIIFKEVAPEPATLSSKWLTEKLRKELGFEGIIITDDLAMNAMNIYQKKAGIKNLAVRAFQAGADMLLYSFKTEETRNMINGFKDAVKSNEISRERILESVHRIIYRKVKLGILDPLIKKDMASWPEDLQRKASFLLQYSMEVNENVKRIETQLARPDSVNDFVSEKGIKTVWGEPSVEPGLHKYALFTDLSVKPEIRKIKKEANKVYPLESIGKVPVENKCVILQTKVNEIENVLGPPRNYPCIIFTVNDPFPRKRIASRVKKDDVIVTTFSPTENSRKKLVEMYLEGIIPPKAAVKFQ